MTKNKKLILIRNEFRQGFQNNINKDFFRLAIETSPLPYLTKCVLILKVIYILKNGGGMNKKWYLIMKMGLFVSAVVFLLMFSLISSTYAIEFSADSIMTSKDGHKTFSKMFYKKDMFRIDMRSPDDISMITRLDKKIVWNVMHREKMYMEMPITDTKKPLVEEKLEGEIDRKLISKETIDGHPTEKYLITYKHGNKEEKIYQWVATDIKFPIKTQAFDGSWTQEFKNVNIKEQPLSLFEVPSGYKRFQMPEGMPMMKMPMKNMK